jgi:signal transduction histidine kinase/CheY-like chemotaxis protein
MERTISWIAAVIGAVIFVALPGAYLQFARAHINATLAAEVEINARLVTQIINSNPELWRYQTDRVLTLLQRRPDDGTPETRRVLDSGGRPVAESASNLAWPLAVRTSDVFDSGRAVGRLEIERSLRPALWQTTAVGFVALGLAALVFVVLRTLPLRALKSALNDLVAQREAAQQFQRERNAAETAARVRSEFLARMSHEIRTPMNGVLGMTELLLQTDLDARQRRFAQTVMSSGRNLLGIINDILDFSKIDAGKLELERIEFDPVELVEDVTQMLAANAWSKRLQLDCVIDAGVPTRFVGDPARLRQVLANLAGNAIKFTEQGSVLLRARRKRAGGTPESLLEIAVIDSGIGISEAARAHLFDPFAQADTSTTRRYGGTGLGLAIARQLTEAMRGRLTVESTQGRGSTFRVELPITDEAPVEPPLPFAAGLRALVIEAADSTRASLAAILQRLAVAADVASDAAAARRLLESAWRAGSAHELVFVDAGIAPQVEEWIGRTDPAPQRRRTLVLLAPIGTPVQPPIDAVEGKRLLVKPIRTADVRALITGIARQDSTVDAFGVEPIAESIRSMRVLLVEDNAVNQMVGASMLKKLGVQFSAAANGREAIDAVGHAPFDLVLMDCQMPVMDGFEATRTIRLREAQGPVHARGPRRVTIVALTASAMIDDRQRCLDAGMDDHLSKPYSIGELTTLLERWSPRPVAVQSVRRA